MSARPIVRVAAGVLLRPDGAVLLADRPPGKAYAGYWEFPGGKIEPGESVAQALARELGEELHIGVAASDPWVVFEFDYPHAYVRLYFRRVREWTGEPVPLEGQHLRFCSPRGELPQPLLPAAVPVMRWLRLPAAIDWPAAPQGRADGAPALREVLIDGDIWRGAGAQDREQLQQAAQAGADFAVVPALGDADLVGLFADPPIPVYRHDPAGGAAPGRARRFTGG